MAIFSLKFNPIPSDVQPDLIPSANVVINVPLTNANMLLENNDDDSYNSSTTSNQKDIFFIPPFQYARKFYAAMSGTFTVSDIRIFIRQKYHNNLTPEGEGFFRVFVIMNGDEIFSQSSLSYTDYYVDVWFDFNNSNITTAGNFVINDGTRFKFGYENLIPEQWSVTQFYCVFKLDYDGPRIKRLSSPSPV